MSDLEKNTIKKTKKRKKNRFGLVYLFLFVFLAALAGISYFVKSYSPDIDVTIGNNEALTLSSTESDPEIKAIDERLKWIQMEDDLPSVALRNQDEKSTRIKDLSDEDENLLLSNLDLKKNDKKEDVQKDDSKKETAKKEPPVPTISDIKKQYSDFREIPTASPVIPAPKPVSTKVYLGSYSDIDEATNIQLKVAAAEPSIVPYVKSVNGKFIVQLGVFSDKERAEALASKLKEKGFNPKLNYDN